MPFASVTAEAEMADTTFGVVDESWNVTLRPGSGVPCRSTVTPKSNVVPGATVMLAAGRGVIVRSDGAYAVTANASSGPAPSSAVTGQLPETLTVNAGDCARPCEFESSSMYCAPAVCAALGK